MLSLVVACAPVDPVVPLPAVSTDGVLPAVRAQMDNARQAVEKAPGDAAKNGEYAMILHAYDRSENANAMYERARSLAPTDPRWPFYQSAVLERLGNIEGALAALDDALALSPDHIDVIAKRGEALFRLGRLDEAETEIAKVIARNPDYPLAQFYRGRLLVERQQWQQAVDVFEDILRRGLNVRDLHQNLGVAHRMLGNADIAEEHLAIAGRDRGLFIKSYDPINMVIAKLNVGDQPHLLAAREYYDRGDRDAAKRELLGALDKNPDSLGAHLHLIRIYAEVNNVDSARIHYDRVLELEPTNATAHSSWALALRNTGQHAESAAAFQRAVDLDPGDPQLQLALGSALSRIGRLEEGLVHLTTSLELAPDNRNTRFLLGNTLLALGSYEDALSELEKALVPEDDKTPLILRAIANAQLNLNNPEAAMQQMRAAATLARKYHNEPLAQNILEELERYQNAQ